jgi:hypothetical protein
MIVFFDKRKYGGITHIQKKEKTLEKLVKTVILFHKKNHIAYRKKMWFYIIFSNKI